MESLLAGLILLNHRERATTLNTSQQCQGSRLLALNQGVSDDEVNIQPADYQRTHFISSVSD